MRDLILRGTICIDGKEYQSDFSTTNHQTGYFYARSERQRGLEQIQVSIQPFTSYMLMQSLEKSETSLTYELQGNHIGNLRFGSDNKEGEWRTWRLKKAIINVTHFSNGISIRFDISTHSGAFTEQGFIDESTIGFVAPVDYWFMIFVPIDILDEFLRGVPLAEWVAPDARIKDFFESLQAAGLEPYMAQAKQP